MIKLQFIINREIMCFIVKGTEIYYTDKIWTRPLRCIPKDENFNKIIMMSRNKYPAKLIEMFNLPESEKKEYDEIAPKGEEALADKIVMDCRGKGLSLLMRENGKS